MAYSILYTSFESWLIAEADHYLVHDIVHCIVHCSLEPPPPPPPQSGPKPKPSIIQADACGAGRNVLSRLFSVATFCNASSVLQLVIPLP